MFRFLRSLFAWAPVRDSGVWRYDENRVTGQRRAVRLTRGCYQPIDFDWLDAGCGHPLVDGRPAWRSAQGQARREYH